jgi:muramoyltetrapeptide carboxypeptidase LdcA involved in peptidoglycan recycling
MGALGSNQNVMDSNS